LNSSFRGFDYGIDVTLLPIQRRNNRYVETGFNLDIQAKSTFGATLTGTNVLYDMEVKTYNDLRETVTGTPRILVLLVLPKKETEWLELSEDELVLRRCAYWLWMQGRPSTNNKTTIRVSIPRKNRFTVEALREIMERRRKGEALQ
jgi:hypothetical protein